MTALLRIAADCIIGSVSQFSEPCPGAIVTDDNKEHQQDEAIEGKAPGGGSFRIPVDRKDVGPEIKWVIRATAVSMIILATGTAIAIVWSMAK